jgi:two-component system nitrate/nitrite response regulator NarL
MAYSRGPGELSMVRAISLESDVKSISVLVVDSSPLTGRLLADALKEDRSLAINTSEASTVMLKATSLKPDVMIISEQLQGERGKGFEVLRELRVRVPNSRTVMLLDSAEHGLVVEAFRNGARGVFCRSDSVKMLSRCVHKVHDRQLWISSGQIEFLLKALAQAPAIRIVDTRGVTLLSRREQDVVRWLAEANTNREIARKLNLTENTVKNYLFRIFNKLGVSSRVEVIIYAASQMAKGQSLTLKALTSKENTYS